MCINSSYFGQPLSLRFDSFPNINFYKNFGCAGKIQSSVSLKNYTSCNNNNVQSDVISSLFKYSNTQSLRAPQLFNKWNFGVNITGTDTFVEGYYYTNSYLYLNCSGKPSSSFGDFFGICVQNSDNTSYKNLLDETNCLTVQNLNYEMSDCSGLPYKTSFNPISQFSSSTGNNIGTLSCINGIQSFCLQSQPYDVPQPYTIKKIYALEDSTSTCASDVEVAFIFNAINTCFYSNNGQPDYIQYVTEKSDDLGSYAENYFYNSLYDCENDFTRSQESVLTTDQQGVCLV